jgi:glycosyltransferase involved in cell wall biosynthesis
MPSGDIEAMAQALVSLAGNPDRAQSMGQAGRARVERQFSLPAMVSAYQGLYDRLLTEAFTRTKRT